MTNSLSRWYLVLVLGIKFVPHDFLKKVDVLSTDK